MDDHKVRSTETGYDAAASSYADLTAVRSAGAIGFFTRFVEALPPGCTVLDLGCGPGLDLGRLQDAGHHPVGIDRSSKMVGLATGAGLLAGRSDLRALPFASGSVDALWSSAALLHVARHQLAETLTEWHRVVRPRATLGLATSLNHRDDGQADEGWELVPARAEKIPRVPQGSERWFVHHDHAAIGAALSDAGWTDVESTIYESTRNWIQLIAKA